MLLLPCCPARPSVTNYLLTDEDVYSQQTIQLPVEKIRGVLTRKKKDKANANKTTTLLGQNVAASRGPSRACTPKHPYLLLSLPPKQRKTLQKKIVFRTLTEASPARRASKNKHAVPFGMPQNTPTLHTPRAGTHRCGKRLQ